MKIEFNGVEITVTNPETEKKVLAAVMGGMATNVNIKPEKPVAKLVKKVKRNSRRFNANKEWSDNEKAELKKEWLSGVKVAEIAKIHGRPAGGIKFMARELKLPRRVNALLSKRDFLKATMPNGIVINSTPLTK